MNLNEKEWKEFFLTGENGLFNEGKGKRLTSSNQIKGNTPLVTAGYLNDGITNYINNPEMELFNNCITIDMFCNCFYRDYEFNCDDNIITLSNDNLNKHHMIFISTIISLDKTRFSYGRQYRLKNLRKHIIKLPVKEDCTPDYEFMEKYMKEMELTKLINSISYILNKIESLKFINIPKLEEKVWIEFNIKDIFPQIQRGKRLTKNKQTSGNTPYISSTALNNGVDNFISNEEKVRRFDDCLTIANSGSVGSSFYHPYEFVASDHVTHLKNKSFNKYIYLFISTLTNRLSEKYNFNREINDKRISKEKIMLPIKDDKNPDYDYMEQYVKNLMFEKYMNYLTFCLQQGNMFKQTKLDRDIVDSMEKHVSNWNKVKRQ